MEVQESSWTSATLLYVGAVSAVWLWVPRGQLEFKAGLSLQNAEMEEDVVNHDPCIGHYQSGWGVGWDVT